MSDFETIIRNPKEFGDRLLDLKNRTMYCDVEITVETERIPAHKIVLVSSSAYFEKIFSENLLMTNTELENMDLETFQSLLEYCYTGIIRVSMKNLRKIMLSAEFLKITPIFEGCTKILEKNIDPSNSISTWKLAKSKNLENLTNIAFEYARKNYEKVSQLPEFLDLNDSEILELLNSDIAVTSETIVLNSVKKWINHDTVSRKQHLDNLSKYIRFEHILVMSDSDLRFFCHDNLSTDCLSKILNARRWKDDKKPMPSDGNLRESYTTLMVVGTETHIKPKTMEIFDLRNEKWIKAENFECYRILYSPVLLEHKLIVIGGEKYYNRGVNTVSSYDLKTGTMEYLPPMKHERERLSAVELEGHIYAIGGRTYRDGERTLTYGEFVKIYFNNVEMWDPVSRTWKECSPMLTPRSGCEAKILDKEIFVVGGYDGKNYLSSTESYNPVLDKWKKCASMNEKRHAPAVAIIDGFLYVAGGMISDDDYTNTAEKYDHKIDKWTHIHSLEYSKAWLGGGNLFGKFVIVGGSNNENSVSTMEMYNDENDRWISMPSLNEPRRMLKAVEIPWSLAKTILSREKQK